MRRSTLPAVAIAGLLLGLTLTTGTPVHGGDVCQVESLAFPDTPQSIMDTDDGDDEDNRWTLNGGNDVAKMGPCDDGGVTNHTNGRQQDDDIGGGNLGDFFEGGTGDDILRGGQSNPFDVADDMFGGSGRDNFVDAEPDDADNASGGDDNDVIDLEDGDGNDNAIGGGGNDSCPVDPGDITSSCDPS